MQYSIKYMAKQRNPYIAAFLSLIVSGLGQIYNGEVIKGVLIIALDVITAYFYASTQIEFWYDLNILLMGLAVVDAYWVSVHNNDLIRFQREEDELIAELKQAKKAASKKPTKKTTKAKKK